MNSNQQPVALITGGSSGLGIEVAAAMLRSGYRVTIVGRNEARLREACDRLSRRDEKIDWCQGDVSVAADAAKVTQAVVDRNGRLDALVNCVGTSDRGLVEKLTADRLDELMRQNVLTALLCSQAAIPFLEQTGGTIVNIGSLASKVGARYIGGYAMVKHALAGMTQQMRLELKPRGVHVALVSPGPIRRSDAGHRYQESVDASMPAQASAPGGGARLKGLPPEDVAQAVLRCIQRRSPDIVLPGYLRLMIGIGHLAPRLGDWLLLKFTSPKDDSKPG
ncbi:MAG: SDR family NAD(P)-dependent oxidoreductase [Rubripirellula sp.]